MNQLSDPASELAKSFHRDHDHAILAQLLEEVSEEFGAQTILAFRRYCLDLESVDTIASDLGISVNAVYLAKFRVIRRLREMQDSIDDLER